MSMYKSQQKKYASVLAAQCGCIMHGSALSNRQIYIEQVTILDQFTDGNVSIKYWTTAEKLKVRLF